MTIYLGGGTARPYPVVTPPDPNKAKEGDEKDTKNLHDYPDTGGEHPAIYWNK